MIFFPFSRPPLNSRIISSRTQHQGFYFTKLFLLIFYLFEKNVRYAESQQTVALMDRKMSKNTFLDLLVFEESYVIWYCTYCTVSSSKRCQLCNKEHFRALY